MGRSPCCDESGLKKGPWTPEEDQKLVKYIQKHGHGSWRALPKLAGLNRCGKSCRLRWTNYLRPDIKRGKFSQEEEQTILNLHSVVGNKWSAIASHLPGRTDNEIKNFWNTHLKKKLIQMGYDPMTHRPRTDIFSSLPHLIALANIKEIMDHPSWEEHALRLQTEGAVEMSAKLQYLQYLLQPAPTSISNNILNPFTDQLDAMNLLCSLFSIKDNSLLNLSQLLETSTPPLADASFQPLHQSFSFSHLPDLELPETPFTTKEAVDNQAPDHFAQLFSHGDASTFPPWVHSSSTSSSPPSMNLNPPASMETSTTHLVEACSTSSYAEAAPSIWPDLMLEDPFFHDIPQF